MNESHLIASRRLVPPARGEFWVFGYGSLMWRPDFAYRKVESALLRGWHRAFCVWSYHYRGTHERPGLVLGLDRGGACRGRAFLVARKDAAAVAGYLHGREMITGVYEPRYVTVELADGRAVRAATFLADRHHQQYAGKLAPARLMRIICAAHGEMGSNLDYLRHTVAHLDELGIADGPLHRLLERAQARSKGEMRRHLEGRTAAPKAKKRAAR